MIKDALKKGYVLIFENDAEGLVKLNHATCKFEKDKTKDNYRYSLMFNLELSVYHKYSEMKKNA